MLAWMWDAYRYACMDVRLISFCTIAMAKWFGKKRYNSEDPELPLGRGTVEHQFYPVAKAIQAYMHRLAEEFTVDSTKYLSVVAAGRGMRDITPPTKLRGLIKRTVRSYYQRTRNKELPNITPMKVVGKENKGLQPLRYGFVQEVNELSLIN